MKATKAIAATAMTFLDHQRLAPTPANYHLAFAIHDGNHVELARMVAVLIDGGVRLSQADADELYERHFGKAATPVPAAADHAKTANEIRHQTLRLADLTASVSATTGEFSRELAFRLPGIEGADAAGLQELVASTLTRSRRAEEALAATTAEVEQLRQRLEAVQGDAERDQLTGLPNRRGIDTHLAAAFAGRRPGSLAICDVDRFKSYNDRYGHAVGDRVLRRVAETLAESLPGHFVGRWGGEEFLLVLHAAPDEAIRLIEAAKTALGDKHFKLRDTDEPIGRITFSGGVVTMPARADELEAALARADALLYQAKNEGRDRILGEDASARRIAA